jgi:hypothetical protein
MEQNLRRPRHHVTGDQDGRLQTQRWYGNRRGDLSSTGLTIQADLDGDGAVLASGTGSSTAYEQIVYAYDSANKKITRQVGDGERNNPSR